MELETTGAFVQAEGIIIIVLVWNYAHVVDVDKFGQFSYLYPMNRVNRLLVTDEPVEIEKNLVEVQDFRKFTDHFRGIYWTYIRLM